MPLISTCENDIIAQASTLFWEKSYDTLPMNDLLKELKLSRYSFYELFESKRDLFLASMDHYFFHTVQPRFHGLYNESADFEDLRTVIHEIVDFIISSNGEIGCLLFKVDGSLQNEDASIQQKVYKQRDYIMHSFEACTQNSINSGALRSNCTVQEISYFCYIMIRGFFSLASDQLNANLLHNLVDSSLDTYIEKT